MTKICFPIVLLIGSLSICGIPNAQETIVEIDYSTPRLFETSYGFAGYGIEGEDGGHTVDEGLVAKHAESKTDGNPDACLTGTFDSSKMKMPENTSYDYVGWGVGSALELKQAWKHADLENYSVSFDAKVAGTRSLSASKFMLNFVTDDDAVEKDEDENDDVVLKLGRGLEDGTDTLTLTNEYQTFTYNLKDDLRIVDGSIAGFAKVDVKKISFTVQAQGDSYDIGKDADNVLYVDNFRINKVEKKK